MTRARKRKRDFKLKKSTYNHCFSPDGSRLITAERGKFAIWDLESTDRVAEIKFRSAWSAAYSHDGRLIAFQSTDGELKIFDAVTMKEKANRKPYFDPSLDVSFSTCNGFLIERGFAHMRILSVETLENVNELPDYKGADYRICHQKGVVLLPNSVMIDSKTIPTGKLEVVRLDGAKVTHLKTLEYPRQPKCSVSPCGNRLLVVYKSHLEILESDRFTQLVKHELPDCQGALWWIDSKHLFVHEIIGQLTTKRRIDGFQKVGELAGTPKLKFSPTGQHAIMDNCVLPIDMFEGLVRPF